MTRNELIFQVAELTSVSPKICDQVLKGLIETIKDSIAAGEKITISGFGTFEKRRRKATIARNPQTGEPMHIAEQNVATFRAGTSLKEAVKAAA